MAIFTVPLRGYFAGKHCSSQDDTGFIRSDPVLPVRDLLVPKTSYWIQLGNSPERFVAQPR